MNIEAEGALCIHHIFEAEAERRPTAEAIISGDRRLSYAQLNQRANQLARHLRNRGVKTRELVGILLDRSPDAIVAILAILKAGAAYVPLDQTHPAARLRHILAEADIRTVLSEGDLPARLLQFEGQVLKIDDSSSPWLGQSTENLSEVELGLSCEDLCYVLYTSGSTGNPKGVMAEHRNVVSFVRAFNQVLGIRPEDRVFQGFSLGFDGSVEEMWMAFSNGATLTVPPRGAAHFGNELAEVITRAGATVLSTVPTSLSVITDPLPNVRLLIVGGERCSNELVERWAIPARRMLNVYGPTETTVNATVAECRPELEVTIGRPLPGYALTIVDEEGQEVPPGIEGELYISGAGVARGYLNQPELTAQHFVQRPGGHGTAVRAYRTGDRVRRDEHGDFHFLGRVDNQVKLRGYRIELLEIEAALTEHASIRSAVVVLATRDCTPELAAYVVASDATLGIDRDAVITLLRSRLPSYMVPAFLDVLTALPTLSSGKIDRKRLPPPQSPLVRAERVTKKPSTELEARILRVFESIFKNDAISVEDDFFANLGGYSLLAAQLVSELRKDLDFEVSIRDVYAHPSVEQLARCVASKKSPGSAAQPAQAIAARRPRSRRVFHSLSLLTRLSLMVVQAACLYAVYGLVALPLVALFVAFRGSHTGDIWHSSMVALGLSAGIWPALLTLSVAVKWLVIGRYRAGAYPLWGSYYLRCWIVRRFQIIAFPGVLVGTPLLPLYYRLMGARVGRNCSIDTAHAAAFDLLTIGDETSIGAETQLLGYHVEDGLFLLGSVTLGERCFVGIHSALGLNVRMEDDALLDDLSLLPDGATIPKAESRRGSPAQPASVSVPHRSGEASSRQRRVLFGVLHGLAIYALWLALLPALIPSAVLLWSTRAFQDSAWELLLLPLAAVIGFVAFCLWIPVLKRLTLARARPGLYATESLFYLRSWAADFLMDASRSFAKPLYTTIYLPAWLRLLGAKIGRRAEISTISRLTPELTEIGEQSFFADGSIIGGRRCHRGVLELAETRIGRRSFVGNSAILPVGKSLGDNCLLGCLSAPPEGVQRTPDGSEWLGSPSFLLPNRVKVGGFDPAVTHEPTRSLIAQRLAVDALRIVIPSAIASAQSGLFFALLSYGFARLSWALWLLFVPAASIAGAAIGLMCVVLTKRILIGTFRPTIAPLWSMFVWLNEAVNGAYETVASPLLTPLLGTPFCAPWLRLLGCKIGRHAYLETTLFSEFDLVRVGDYAALNAGSIVQNHLFEDRIMKASFLQIGDDCSVGGHAVVLYDSEMQPGSALGPLSLLMKGETLPADTRWLGIPTAQVNPSVLTRLREPSVLLELEPIGANLLERS